MGGRLLVTLLLLAQTAGADELSRAKQLYSEGKQQFEQQHYEAALRLFERSYEASARPALLFDMATCLSALDRPREAAAKLRAFLDRVPNEPQRGAIESSIGELKARAAEQEAALKDEKNDPQRAALEARIRLLEERLGSAPPPPSKRKRNLAIGLGVAAGVLVIAGTGLTLGLALNHGENPTPSSFAGGPLQATR